jgi:chromosomal replication initiator protein
VTEEVPSLSRNLAPDIIVLCERHFGFRPGTLAGEDQHKPVCYARHIAMFVIKRATRCSFPELGAAFGGRDHTTAMAAVRKIARLFSEDERCKADVLRIFYELEHP